MALYNQKNVLTVMVGKNTTAIADAVVVDNYADLADGDIVILDADNVVHETVSGSAIAKGTQYKFATRVGTQLIYSPFWKPEDIVSIKAKAYAAAVQQVSYIGYIGSGTGNIEAIDENEYIIRILLEGTEATFGNKQMYKFGAYKSSASATSAEVAIGLVDNLYYNFKREPAEIIKFQAICNAAVTAANGFKTGQEVTVVNGLNYVVCETDVTYTAAGSSTLVVGDYLRIGSATDTNNTTTLTSAVYKVTKIDSLNVYLDRPVTAASGTYQDASGSPVSIEVIPSATGLAAQWGIKCTGVAQTNFKAGVFNYVVPSFKIEPQNCGTTTVTYSTAASKGSGTYGQVAELEWFAQGNLGLRWRVDTPPVTLHTQASSSSTYETIAIKYKTDSASDSVTGTTPASHAEIVLAFVVNSDSGDKIIATLTEWAASNLGYSVSW